MQYWVALLLCSLLVAGAEALRPWRRQKRLRRWLWSDLVHLVFNGHFLGVILAVLTGKWVLPWLEPLLHRIGMDRAVAARWPLWLQFCVALFGLDFIQWNVHRLLHRVPFLWCFHQVHHSVTDGEMDFIVSFRFHFMEVVVYRTAMYLPLVFFGFGGNALFLVAVVGTLIGHLNHSNLDLGHGRWRYVLNSPRMHLWHHDADAAPDEVGNFGIILSAWDYLFGTARVPGAAPRRLGFPGVEQFPRTFFGHELWPLSRYLRKASTTLNSGK